MPRVRAGGWGEAPLWGGQETEPGGRDPRAHAEALGERGLSRKSPGPSPAPGPLPPRDGPADTSELASQTAVTTSPPAPCRTKATHPKEAGPTQQATGAPSPPGRGGLPRQRHGAGGAPGLPARLLPRPLLVLSADPCWATTLASECPGLRLGPLGQRFAPRTAPMASPASGGAPTSGPDGR